MGKVFLLISCMVMSFFDDLNAMSSDVFSNVAANNFSNVPEYLRPIEAAEYMGPCRKFAVKFPANDIPDAILECGVNPDNIFVITPESIIKGAFYDDLRRVNYFRELLNSEAKLRKAFWRFVYSTFVSCEACPDRVPLMRTLCYRDFVFKTITAGFRVEAYRQRVVSFLAALEYRKKINPKFEVRFNIGDKMEERLVNDNLLLFGFELKDGRHYSDLGKNAIRLTIPFGFNGCRTDNTYVCMHEIGHAIHDLLRIRSRRIPLSISSENVWMRNTFFPLLNKVEGNESYFEELVKDLIMRGISSEKSILDCFYYLLDEIKVPYRGESQPYDKDEFIRMGLTQVESMLADEKIGGILRNSNNIDDVNSELLSAAVRLITRHTTFFNLWTNAEEMFQIAGIASIGGYIIVDRNADLAALLEQNRAGRWGHTVYNFVPKPNNKLFNVAKMLVPDDKYAESLFALHGLDFHANKKRNISTEE